MDNNHILKYLQTLTSQDVAKSYKRFFKTSKGEYSYGDIFLGIKVPLLRQAVKKFRNTPLKEIEKLLNSKYHEVRHFALLHMVTEFSKADQNKKQKIFDTYLKNLKYVNNWDLVDCSAYHIIGAYLKDKDKDLLYKLARSKSLWERRISIVSTFYFIKQNKFDDTFNIAQILLNDKEDLIHKAVGWMLREVGKKNELLEKEFLKIHYKKMPRVMLRYAIEKFPKNERKLYLQDKI